jgi:hypothetical protein
LSDPDPLFSVSDAVENLFVHSNATEFALTENSVWKFRRLTRLLTSRLTWSRTAVQALGGICAGGAGIVDTMVKTVLGAYISGLLEPIGAGLVAGQDIPVAGLGVRPLPIVQAFIEQPDIGIADTIEAPVGELQSVGAGHGAGLHGPFAGADVRPAWRRLRFHRTAAPGCRGHRESGHFAGYDEDRWIDSWFAPTTKAPRVRYASPPRRMLAAQPVVVNLESYPVDLREIAARMPPGLGGLTATDPTRRSCPRLSRFANRARAAP